LTNGVRGGEETGAHHGCVRGVDRPASRSSRAGACGLPADLHQWRDAFLTIVNQADSGAIKVAIDQR
jgi:hypothetical protein